MIMMARDQRRTRIERRRHEVGEAIAVKPPERPAAKASAIHAGVIR